MSGYAKFQHAPHYEVEVAILFGSLLPHLGRFLDKAGFGGDEIVLAEYSDAFPDCTLEVDGEEVEAEFEVFSSKFRTHKHDPDECDLIICWMDDYPNRDLPVIELAEVVSRLDKEGKDVAIKDPQDPVVRYPSRLWDAERFFEELESKNEQAVEPLRDVVSKAREGGVDIWGGSGDKTGTLHLGQGLVLESNGKAYICYENVNAAPPEPIFSPEVEEELKELLGEESKSWHYIQFDSIKELASKLNEILKIKDNL